MKTNRHLSSVALVQLLLIFGAAAGFASETPIVNDEDASATVVVDGMMKAKSGAT